MILENHATGCGAQLANPSRRFVCLDEMMEDLGTAVDDVLHEMVAIKLAVVLIRCDERSISKRARNT